MECRKSVADLTPTEKSDYVQAVLALKTAPSRIPAAQTAVTNGGGTPNRYDDYVWMHFVVGFGAHRGPAFGPWHREYLRQLELDLRQVSGKPHISIPYWDWSVDQTPASAGWPFTDDFIGPFGDAAGANASVVTTGLFSNSATWRINIRHPQVPAPLDTSIRLRRTAGVPAPDTLPKRDPAAADPSPSVLDGLAVTPYDAAPFNSQPQNLTAAQFSAQVLAAFRKYLEWLLHDGIHGWIGGLTGQMSYPPTAVNDPIFFLHHANVDRLWAVWQQLHPALGYVPAAGAPAGHNAGQVMSQFADASWFNFPLAPETDDGLDWHARGVWYRSDLPTVTPNALSLNFDSVPEGLTTYRPVQFSVRTCQPVRFMITAISGGNFSTPPTQGVVLVDHDETLDPVTANVYVAFVANPPLGVPQAGSVTIEAYINDRDGYFAPAVNGEYVLGSWTVNLTATPIARPRSAITFVLDRSGSMSEPAGAAGTKVDLLRSSLQSLADVMADNDAVGLVSYDDLVATLANITGMGPLPGGPGRTAVASAIAGTDLDPRGLTGIGSGMIQGATVLDAERTNPATPYSRFAMIVMTDGNENVAPSVTSSQVATAISGFSDSVYAIGLGQTGNVSETTLGAIAKYMLITGDITSAERRFRLVKYFAQIVAAVTNNVIVTDPDGDLHLGVEHRIPFRIADGDVSFQAIVFAPAAYLLDYRLEAPDGTIFDPTTASPNVSFYAGQEDAFYRAGLPALPGVAGTHAGQWTAILRISRRPGTVATNLRRAATVASQLAQTRTLPYSFMVQAYSNVMFDVEVAPGVGPPGSVLALHARLREYSVPLENAAQVTVDVTDPFGLVSQVPMTEGPGGAFGAAYTATVGGLYRFRFRAQGSTSGGMPFQREETRTAAIVRPRPPGDGGFGSVLEEERQRLCALITCLVRSGSLNELFERNGIDEKRFLRCFARYCRGSRTTGR